MTIPQFLAERYDILVPDGAEGDRLLAYDTTLDREVGVTVFPEGLVHELAEWAKRVIDLDPSGLLVPEELGLDADGRPYLVEPWPSAGTLEAPDRGLSPLVHASVLADAIAALALLHGQGLAHGGFNERNIGVVSTEGGLEGRLSVPGLAYLLDGAEPSFPDDVDAAQRLAVRQLALLGHEYGGPLGLSELEQALRDTSQAVAMLEPEAGGPQGHTAVANAPLSGSKTSLEELLRAVLALAEQEPGEDTLQAALGSALVVSQGTSAVVCRAQQHNVMTLMATGEPLEPGPWQDVVAVVVEDTIPRLAVISVDGTGARRWALIAPLMASSLALVVASAPDAPAYGVEDLDRLSMFAVTAGLVMRRTEAVRSHGTQRRRFDAVLSGLSEAVLVVDSADVIVALSAGAAQLLGVDGAEVVGAAIDRVEGADALWRAAVAAREGERRSVELNGARVKVRVVELGSDLAVFVERDTTVKAPKRRRTNGLRYSFEDLVGESEGLSEVVNDARMAAGSDAAVLITGESGTGKEVLAQAIHGASERSGGPFVAINVAAIPGELLESELFGYDRGAFTGARAGGMQGKFELANGGTLLLDEIGDMPMQLQAKLLRVLQERRIQRLGGTRDVPVDVRIISTTHRFLEQSVSQGDFRLDLFYRLKVVHLELPPLRERPGDVPLLLKHHLDEACRRAGRPPLRISEHVMDLMKRHKWPGNVREVANVAEAWVSLTPSAAAWIDAPPRGFAELAGQDTAASTVATSPAVRGPVRPLAEVEREAILEAVKRLDGNLSKAARALEVSRGTLYNKLARYRGE